MFNPLNIQYIQCKPFLYFSNFLWTWNTTFLFLFFCTDIRYSRYEIYHLATKHVKSLPTPNSSLFSILFKQYSCKKIHVTLTSCPAKTPQVSLLFLVFVHAFCSNTDAVSWGICTVLYLYLDLDIKWGILNFLNLYFAIK